MSRKIELLDCTLRDGAYIVDAKFGAPAIRGIIKKSQEANIEIIECGWLKDKEYEDGTTFFHVPDDLKQYIDKKQSDSILAVMIDWDRYSLDNLPQNDGKSIDAIRVVFPHGKYREGIEVGRKIRAKGYQVFYQLANTLAYSNDELMSLADEINTVDCVAVSVVDTFGAMYEEDLERIVAVLNKNLSKKIGLGFHSHNNQQLSFALTMHFIELLQHSSRVCMVDASLCGMGRGAGNATTELVANYLNRKQNCNYDMDAIMDAIDIYMEYFKEYYTWGYSTPYFIAGMYCCHVNNIAYLLENHRTNAKDMRNIIESLSEEDRRKYDYDLLEEKYIENQSRLIDDEKTVVKIKDVISNRNVLLVAPGKSSINDSEKIIRYIQEEKPIVIGVNAIIYGYQYDYLFFTNSARYHYARETYPEIFNHTQRLLLSNIKTKTDSDEMIINFNRVIKRGWKYFDNAVICCLRFMDKLKLTHLALAGFDGFKSTYNESYADESLPSLNLKNNWDEVNQEIRDMFHDFIQSANYCRQVDFITDSIFNH